MVNQTIQIQISGKVQHVGFRYSAQKRANDLGINGFVKNLPNGDVYAEVSGSPELLSQFEAWCLHGPPLAKVHHINVEKIDYKEFNSFEIRAW